MLVRHVLYGLWDVRAKKINFLFKNQITAVILLYIISLKLTQDTQLKIEFIVVLY